MYENTPFNVSISTKSNISASLYGYQAKLIINTTSPLSLKASNGFDLCDLSNSSCMITLNSGSTLNSRWDILSGLPSGTYNITIVAGYYEDDSIQVSRIINIVSPNLGPQATSGLPASPEIPTTTEEITRPSSRGGSSPRTAIVNKPDVTSNISDNENLTNSSSAEIKKRSSLITGNVVSNMGADYTFRNFWIKIVEFFKSIFP